MEGKNKKGIGLKFAINGIIEAFLHERNFRIHIAFAIVVIALSFYFSLSALEWLFVLIAIQLVILTELINSIVERIIDHVKPEIHPKAMQIKDMGASIVLISAIFAIIIGLIIFLPKICYG